MVYTSYLSIFHEDTPFSGSVRLPDHDDEPGKMACVPVLGFEHGNPELVVDGGGKWVGPRPEREGIFYSPFEKPERPESYRAYEKRGVWLYDDRCFLGINDYVRKHEDIAVVIPFEKNAVPLYSLIAQSGFQYSFLKKVELYFYAFNETFRKETEYFRFTLEHVLLTQVKQWFDNVKNPTFERRGPMLQLMFRYQRITWLHRDGYLLHTDEWEDGFTDGNKRDFSDKGYVVLDTPATGGALSATIRSVIIDESKEPLSINKTFRVKIDAVLSRTIEPTEKKEGYLGLALFSRYKGREMDMHLAGHDTYLDSEGMATGSFPPLPVNKEWEADRDRFPDEPVYYRVRVENKNAQGFAWSEWVAVPKPPKKIKLPWFIDCHAHFFAPKASPLPTIWVQNPVTKALKPSWEVMENPVVQKLISFIEHDLPQFAGKTTETLGVELMNNSEKVLKDDSLEKFMGKTAERQRIVVGLGIDMEMAHYWGYEGKMVYQKDENGRPGYFMYEKTGERKWRPLTNKEVNNIVDYPKQVNSAQTVFKENKGLLLSFFPFDPRHWLGYKSSDYLGKTWHSALKNILQYSDDIARLKKYTAIGFKLYTALGYRPDDYKPHNVISKGEIAQKKKLSAQLPELRDFFATCSASKIPITCHCSRGGIFAHDFMLYYDYLFGGDDASEKEKKSFFYDSFVSPFAWERVLQDFPNLYLCLAHCGGEEEWLADEKESMPWATKCIEMAADPRYPNFYIDLAYCTFKEPVAKKKFKKMLEKFPKLKEKVLFGTDWYLIGSEIPKYGKYENYFKGAIEALHWIDPELPAYAMALNPKRFLDLERVAERIVKIFGDEYASLLKLVKDTIPETIEKFYV